MLTRRPNTSGMDPEKTTGILAAQQDLVSTLQSRMPGLLAIYAFGSRVQGTAGPQSDLDLAVLVAGYADPVVLWELSGELADLAGCPVELLDLRAASTLMQHQIITTGHRWRANDSQAALADDLKRMGEFALLPCMTP